LFPGFTPHFRQSLIAMELKLITIALVFCVSVIFFANGVRAANFGEDTTFLKEYTDLIVLSDSAGQGKVAISPTWQGRVMTSTAGGDEGLSFGWINRELIESKEIQKHINVFGGEDRFWMGPEGGQFSIFFAKGAKFELADWYTPAAIDTLPFKVVSKSRDQATFSSKFSLTNYSGTQFEVAVKREVRLLDAATTWKKLGVPAAKDVSLVAYESDNCITNAGEKAWKKETGLVSVWILGMFNPSPSTTVVVPIREGSEAELGVKVTSDYFGEIPPERLVVKDDVMFFSADGKFRSKIGVNPKRSKAILGSYDADNKVLTIAQFNQPEGVTDYVNSLWKLAGQSLRRRRVEQLQRRPARTRRQASGPVLRDRVVVSRRGPGSGKEPHAYSSHDSPFRIGGRPGHDFPGHAGRVTGGDPGGVEVVAVSRRRRV
jgi:hypothetical protein